MSVIIDVFGWIAFLTFSAYMLLLAIGSISTIMDRGEK